MRSKKNLWKETPLSLLPLSWALLAMCTTQVFAQNTADWIGGSGVWSNPEMWYCSGSISDLDGDCVPNGFNVDVSFDRGGQAILDKSASTNALILSNGSSLSVGSGVSLTNALEDIIDGSLTISGGGVVKDSIASVGLAGSGTATVTGKGSQWQFAGGLSGLTIGGAGQGTLLIENGGVVSGAPAGLGDSAGSSGTVTVTGLGSQWNASFLNIGVFGRGTVTTSSGGAVNVVGSGVSLGSQAGAQGTVTVTGLGSQFNVTPEVVVGGGGQGTLTLQQGATGSSLNLYVGGVAGGTGTVMLTDAGTKWTNSTGTVIVGDAGTGTLTVQNEADLSAQNEIVGYSHVGTLNLSGGSNSVMDTLTLGASASGTGTYNLSGTGSLTVAGKGLSVLAEVVGEDGTGYFFQTGGTNTVSGGSLAIGEGNTGYGGYVQSGGQTSVLSDLDLALQGTGEYYLSRSGTLTVSQKEDIGVFNAGTFKQSGGTNTATSLRLGVGPKARELML